MKKESYNKQQKQLLRHFQPHFLDCLLVNTFGSKATLCQCDPSWWISSRGGRGAQPGEENVSFHLFAEKPVAAYFFSSLFGPEIGKGIRKQDDLSSWPFLVGQILAKISSSAKVGNSWFYF